MRAFRIVLFVLGAALIAYSLLTETPHWIPLVIWGSILLLASLVENWRYKQLGQGPKAGWELTDERFVNPETQQLVRVLFNPRTGERQYQADPESDHQA